MTVTAEKAIYFECEKCGYRQYHHYTLEKISSEIMENLINCESCGQTNHVIEEIKTN